MQTFALPDVGEGLAEAEILAWHVAVGDAVTVNQVIVEVETAKAAVELPCPYSGTVAELLVAPGDTVPVGAAIIAINDGTEQPAPEATSEPAPEAARESTPEAASKPAPEAAGGTQIGEETADGRIATLVGYVAGPGAPTRRKRRPPGSTEPPAQLPAKPPTQPAESPTQLPAKPPTQPAESPTQLPAEQPTQLPVESPTRPAADQPRPAEPQPAEPTAVSTVHDRRDGRISSGKRGQTSNLGDHGPGEPVGEQDRAEAAVPLAKPPVRKLAGELGIDLRTLTGSGPGGVITRDDVRAGARSAANGTSTSDAPADPASGVRRVPVHGVRKATAAAMVTSAFTAPHVTEFLTVDVTPMIELRDRLRAHPDWAWIKLSPLTFAAKAACLAAQRTPEVNASWDEPHHEIVYYDRVQLGIAAATPRGLVVPRIRDADLLSLRELATALTELTETARAGRTPPEDLAGGTFTITNIGVFGVDTGTPILNPGESAILALGAVRQAPWVLGGELAVRTVCQLALSFDHRVVDGEQGSRFLAEVGALLADPGLALTY